METVADRTIPACTFTAYNTPSLTLYFDCLFASLADANGNITHITAENGDVLAQYEYGPFGNITASSGAKKDDFSFRFSSKYYDSETGLYYYGYRYLWHSRWMSRDPIEEEGGLNLYAFCGNEPVGKVDRLGRSATLAVKADIDAIKDHFLGTTVDSAMNYTAGVVAKLYAAYGSVGSIAYGSLPAGVSAMYTTGSSVVTIRTGYTGYAGGSLSLTADTLHELTHAYDDIFLGISFSPLDDTEGHASVAENLCVAMSGLLLIEEKLGESGTSCEDKRSYVRSRWESVWRLANYANPANTKDWIDLSTSPPTPVSKAITAADHSTYVSDYGLRFRCANARNALNSLVPKECKCKIRFSCEEAPSYASPSWDIITTGQDLPLVLQ